jgi:ligand-binding sensor domain-containing protein
LIALGLSTRPATALEAHTKISVRINPQAVRLPIVDAMDNRFVRLSTTQGVSQIKVDQIVQDDDGFMWFGTRYGLYRYDGYGFKVFVREHGNPNSLNGVVINALFKGRDGGLWVACDQSLNKFDRTTETFRQYPVPYATHITEDTAGRLWVASRNGLYRLDPLSGQIQHYTSDPNDPSSLSGNDLSYCGEDRRGALWIASSGHLDEFDRKTGKITRHISIPETSYGFGFYEDRFGVFWIFHSSPGALSTLDRDTNILTHYAFPEREPTVMSISAMLEDKTGALWMTTPRLGCAVARTDYYHPVPPFYSGKNYRSLAGNVA